MGQDHLDTLVRLLGRYPWVRLSATKFRVDLGVRCDAPVTIERFARPEAANWPGIYVPTAKLCTFYNRTIAVEPGSNHPIQIEIEVPCRKCVSCLRHRANLWRGRAQAEFSAAVRTWFCTFTLTPDEQFNALLRARAFMAERSTVFEELSEADQFCARVRAINPDITRYVKRVRKQSGSPLRYLFVAERHESGLPHFHALFHERNAAMPLRKSVLKGQWLLGHSQFKLAEPAAAWYVCKYLSKELATRVRGSLNYGQAVQTISNVVEFRAAKNQRDVTPHDTTGKIFSLSDRDSNEGREPDGMARSIS